MMTATCDGCGKEEQAEYRGGNWQKPLAWWFRADKDGDQLVCSVACRRSISKATGKDPEEGVLSILARRR